MSSKTSNKVLKQSLDTIMSDRFGRYSKYIIQDRALPDSRDGLKPVQRRILYAMNDLGLTHEKSFKKSARVVGEVIGKYHPHGDSSIYEAMVRMSQDWKINVPLVTMHGNNGSIDDDPAAAMRYTEVRLSKISSRLLSGIKFNTVPFAPNFDDSEEEPTVLPATFPNLLINGAKGIAAGYATEMPPHNLGEVIDASIAYIKSNNIKLNTLLNHIKGPDFPTGGIVQGSEGIFSAFERGKGRIVIRSKVKIMNLKNKPTITITEIPYGVVKSKLIRNIDELRFTKKVHGIKEILDETDRNGIAITIRLAPGTDVNLVLNYLYQKTDLQVYYNYNNIAIKDRAPKLLSLRELIESFVDHQKIVQRKEIQFIFDKETLRHEIVSGLVRVADIADKVIDVIRKSSGSRAGVIKELMHEFKFTENQAAAIAELRLYRLSSTDQSVYLKEKEELELSIKKYKVILDNQEEMNEYIIEKLKKIKKEFAVPRKTVIEDKITKIEIDPEDLIKHEDIYLGVTKMGYIKSFSIRSMDSNDLLEYGMKTGDSLIFLEKVNTSAKLTVICDDGKYIYIPIHKIKDNKFKNIGQHINDFASMNPLSSVVAAFAIEDFSLNVLLTLVTQKGKAKRVKLSEFDTSRYSKSLTAMKLGKEDKLVGAKLTHGGMQIILVSSSGKAVKYVESTIPVQGIKASGIVGMSLREDYVTALIVAESNKTIYISSDKGGLKRMKVSSITPCTRTTRGKELFKVNKNKLHLINEGYASNSKTNILFNAPNQNKIVKAGAVDITDSKTGLTIVAAKQLCVAKTFGFDYVNKKSDLLKAVPASAEETFKEAEDEINKISQLSLKDLLSDI